MIRKVKKSECPGCQFSIQAPCARRARRGALGRRSRFSLPRAEPVSPSHASNEHRLVATALPDRRRHDDAELRAAYPLRHALALGVVNLPWDPRNSHAEACPREQRVSLLAVNASVATRNARSWRR